MLCCGYTLTDFPISIRLTSLALWQSNDCPSASKATLMNMDKYSCEFIMNDYITTTKQSTTKPCAYFLGYTVFSLSCGVSILPGPLRSPKLTDISAWASYGNHCFLWAVLIQPQLYFNFLWGVGGGWGGGGDAFSASISYCIRSFEKDVIEYPYASLIGLIYILHRWDVRTGWHIKWCRVIVSYNDM